MAPIDKVPPEVLLSIFKEHVWSNSDSPQRLIRVSKLWYDVASTGLLWGDIVLCEQPDAQLRTMYGFPGINRSAMRNKILCRSVGSLALAIERTRGSKFELIITSGEDHTKAVCASDDDWDLIQSSWFSKRCQALRIYGWSSTRFSTIFSNFSALEEFGLLDTGPVDSGFVNTLLETVLRTSKKLRCFQAPTPQGIGFTRLEPVLSAVSTLCVADYWGIPLDTLVNAAISVETLELRSSRNSHHRGSLDSPSPFLDTLILKSVPCNLLSSDTAYKIRHLTTHYSFVAHGNPQPLEFPNLTHITMTGGWEAMLGIRAPRLEYLTLRGWCRAFDSTGLIALRPTVLICDVVMSEAEVRGWIQDLCQSVRDLQFIYQRSNRSLWRPLASWLKGKEEQEPEFPHLQRLKILSAQSDKRRQERSEKILQGVVDAWKGRECLKEVKYGWYEGWCCDEPEGPHITWTSLLEELA